MAEPVEVSDSSMHHLLTHAWIAIYTSVKIILLNEC